MDLLISPCTQLLTLAGPPGPRRGLAQRELGLVEPGAVWIEGREIKAAGPAAEIESRVKGKALERISAKGCVVLPGFVDSHAHPVFLTPRQKDYEARIQGASYQEIAAAGGGILSSVRAVRQATPQQLLDVTLPRLQQMLRCGTTTLEAKSGYGLDLENEIKMLEVIQAAGAACPLELAPTFLGAHAIPPEFQNARNDYVQLLVEQMIPEIAQRRLAEFCDCFVEPHLFDLEAARLILEAAARHGLKIKLHADQLERSGATQLGVNLKAVSVDHLEQIQANDIAALAQSDTIATLLPGSVYHLGLHGYPPARALVEAGAAVALATDFNPGTSPTPNMQMILSLACTQMRMTPAEAIVAATINGAWALDRASRLGSLEPGKQADLCIMDVEDYRLIPYFFGVDHCKMTIKAGEVVWNVAPK